MAGNILVYGLADSGYLNELKARALKATAFKVYIMEGRPDLFGAKFLARELLNTGIKPVLITDNTAGLCIYKKVVDEVNIFYYKKNADSLTCRVGSLMLAVVARYNNIPVFAYKSAETMKESAPEEELFYFEDVKIAPDGIKAYVPLIDEVPVRFISGVKS